MAAKKKKESFPSSEPIRSMPKTTAATGNWQELMAQRWHLWLVFGLIVIGGTVVYSLGMGRGNVAEWEYEVVAVHPHDRTAFTQGLHYYDGYLYESTGLEGFSTIRKVNIETGEPEINIPLDPHLFGEGLTMVGDQFFQITWKSGVGFVYNTELQQVRKFDYAGQGWGLTYDGRHLIMSDGATFLRFFDPQTMQEAKRIPVSYGSVKMDQINEMEYVDGLIFANRWKHDVIYVIDPETGRIVAKVSMQGLLPANERPSGSDDGALNGIAYNPKSGTFFVTGKKWPKLFEIRIKRR